MPDDTQKRDLKLIENLLLPIALAGAIALFLVLTNKNIPFANGGNCDPWRYFGHFFIGDQLAMLGPTRAGARLPTILIGYLSTQLFKGVLADYVNFFVLFVSATVAVYLAAKRLFGLLPALVAAIFFATDPLVIGNYSVTYTSPAFTYTMIAIAFAIFAATLAPGGKQTAAVVAAGFFWGTAIHAHLYSLSYNFVIVLYVLDWSLRPIRDVAREIAVKWGLLLAGTVIATLTFCLINALFFHGTFWFFLKQYQDAFTALVGPFEKANWYLTGGRGAVLVAGTAAAAAGFWLLRRGTAEGRKELLTALVPFATLELAQIAYTFLGGITLEYDYYFVWLIGPLALLIASLAARVTLRGATAIVAVGVYLIASLAADFGRLDTAWQGFTAFPPSLAVAILLVAVAAWFPRYPKATILAAFLILTLMNATIRPEKIGIAAWEGNNGDVYRRLRPGLEFISGFRFTTRPKFWLNIDGPMWETIAYPRSYDNACLVDTALPNFLRPGDSGYNRDSENFAAGDNFVMVPSDAKALSEAVANLKARGLNFQEMGRKSISYQGLAYIIVVGRLH